MTARWVLPGALALAACSVPSSILIPPVRYQGDRTVVVMFLDPEAVPAQCKAMGDGLELPAYAQACQKGGLIIMPNPCRWPTRSEYGDLACHELAHANGWPANHPKS
jgi:hypothetical protein